MYNGQPPPVYPQGYGYPPPPPPPQPPHLPPPPQPGWTNDYMPRSDHANGYPPRPPPPPTTGVPEWYDSPVAGPSSQPYTGPPGYVNSANAPYPPPTPHGFHRGSYSSPHGGNPASAAPSATRSASEGADKESDKAEKDKSAKKRKKKSNEESGNKEEESEAQKEKRTKTGRACDACRTKKIRCDILPPEDRGDGEPQPICAHCKQAGLECTFYMPITETRFKKKRQETAEQDGDITSLNSALMAEGTTSPYDEKRPREVPVRLEGPTSLSFLLQTSLPAGASDAYDLREHNKWEISEDGTGMIQVSAPPTTSTFGDAPADPRSQQRHIKPVLSADTMSELVNAYFDHIAPLFPVVSKSEFTSKSNVSPLLLYAICGLGATRRQFPRDVFAGVRGVINGLLRSNDILSDARFEHVQALLLLAQVGDLHAQPTAATASASLIRMATAIRMAQDLGLHRESTIRAQTAEDLAFVELRRRVWASCVIMDRWYGAALGIPLLVDLLDCDVLLPAPYDIKPDIEPSSWPIESSFLALSEHLKLSILVGRVLKTIYSPTGLKNISDEQLYSLLADMTAWKDNLPDELQFKGPQSSHHAGLLHMGHAAMQFLFWRVFMRIQYTCPPHLSFRLHVDNWSAMLQWSTESITWLAQNDDALDTLFIYPYTATSCALIQYHTWARRRDSTALEMLKVVKEIAMRWEQAVQPDQMSIRRKTCETMTLLYEAALKTNPEVEEAKDRPTPINPTAGVLPRASVGRVAWIPDTSRKGGGIWIAATAADRQESGVPNENCLLVDDLEPGSDYARLWEIAKNSGVGEVRSRASDTTATDQANGALIPPMAPQQTLSDVSQPGGMQPGSMHQMDAGNGAFSDVQSGTNVNPSINLDPVFPPNMTVVAPGSEIVAASLPQADGSTVNTSLLDGLPMNGFDFPSWEQYFQTINGNIPETFGGMQ